MVQTRNGGEAHLAALLDSFLEFGMVTPENDMKWVCGIRSIPSGVAWV